ncbi:hypothetical protein, conserved [Leishmania tarentolae]|uniref:Uncharacterized protein n=1 Tax=Leishmania tarentolae TaxID=5689 RepID=A0A640KW70_LEITA|nr:hypothetical protein, conserved [Leishmania tarentolae]
MVHATTVLHIVSVQAYIVLRLLWVEKVHTDAVHLSVAPLAHIFLAAAPNYVDAPAAVVVAVELTLIAITLRVQPVAAAVLLGAKVLARVRGAGRELKSAHLRRWRDLAQLLWRHGAHSVHQLLYLHRALYDLRRRRLLLLEQCAHVPLLRCHDASLIHVVAIAILLVLGVVAEVVSGAVVVEEVQARSVHLPCLPISEVLLAGLGKDVDTESVLLIILVLTLVSFSLRVRPVAAAAAHVAVESTLVHGPGLVCVSLDGVHVGVRSARRAQNTKMCYENKLKPNGA